jgi:hypothetical protein
MFTSPLEALKLGGLFAHHLAHMRPADVALMRRAVRMATFGALVGEYEGVLPSVSQMWRRQPPPESDRCAIIPPTQQPVQAFQSASADASERFAQIQAPPPPKPQGVTSPPPNGIPPPPSPPPKAAPPPPPPKGGPTKASPQTLPQQLPPKGGNKTPLPEGAPQLQSDTNPNPHLKDNFETLYGQIQLLDDIKTEDIEQNKIKLIALCPLLMEAIDQSRHDSKKLKGDIIAETARSSSLRLGRTIISNVWMTVDPVRATAYQKPTRQSNHKQKTDEELVAAANARQETRTAFSERERRENEARALAKAQETAVHTAKRTAEEAARRQAFLS